MPREFIYAGAIVLWIAGFVWTVGAFDLPDNASHSTKGAGCILWGILVFIVTAIDYLLASGAMRYAQ